MHCVSELCYILIISIFNFLIFLIFKFSSIKSHKYSTLDGGIKGEESLKKLL